MIGLNQNTVKIETSKAFTPLESQVVGMLHRLVYQQDDAFYKRWTHDRDHAMGVFTSGGTIANITSLWVARNKLLAPRNGFAGIYEDGLAAGLVEYGYKSLAVVTSKRGHYSLKKAADLLGLGRRNLIALPTDAHQKMDPKRLREELKRLQQEGVGIVAVVGIAGTTETGHVDPLADLADVCAEAGVHFHVDAAWGGPVLFSDRYRHLLNGIDKADSVVIDAHKQLYVPMGCGMALFKNPKSLSSIETYANYIIRRGSRDLGKHTLEGSRPGMALLVHSGLRVLGRKGYELLIDTGIGKAAQFAKLIQGDVDFELVTEPELNLLTYRYVPQYVREAMTIMPQENLTKLNDLLSLLTIHVQKEQRDRGKSFVSRTTIEVPHYGGQPLTVFRSVLANPLTTRQILSDVLAEQKSIAAEYFEKKKSKFDRLLNK
jgi:glutamate decarboxylase